MDPAAAAILESWSFEPGVLLALSAIALIYLRGFRAVARQLPARFPAWRRAAFLGGVATIAIALVSPIDAFADVLLQVHMLQHWLLMMVAAPLLWLGAPVVPLLRGLPRRWLKQGLGPFLAWPELRRGLERLSHPVVALLVFIGTTLVWHTPTAYEAALRSRDWHDLEHAMFLGAAMLFWYPVLSPWPARRSASSPAMVLYLAAAALFNTVFSASFAFSQPGLLRVLSGCATRLAGGFTGRPECGGRVPGGSACRCRCCSGSSACWYLYWTCSANVPQPCAGPPVSICALRTTGKGSRASGFEASCDRAARDAWPNGSC